LFSFNEHPYYRSPLPLKTSWHIFSSERNCTVELKGEADHAPSPAQQAQKVRREELLAGGLERSDKNKWKYFSRDVTVPVCPPSGTSLNTLLSG